MMETRRLLRLYSNYYIHISFIQSLFNLDKVDETLLDKLGEPFIGGYYDLFLLADKFKDEEWGELLLFWYECYSRRMRVTINEGLIYINEHDFFYMVNWGDGLLPYLKTDIWLKLDKAFEKANKIKDESAKRAMLCRLNGIKEYKFCENDIQVGFLYHLNGQTITSTELQSMAI